MPFDGAVIVADPYPARTSSNGITPELPEAGNGKRGTTTRHDRFPLSVLCFPFPVSRFRYLVTTLTSLPGTTTTSATCLPSMNFRTFSLLIASDFASASVSPAGT